MMSVHLPLALVQDRPIHPPVPGQISCREGFQPIRDKGGHRQSKYLKGRMEPHRERSELTFQFRSDRSQLLWLNLLSVEYMVIELYLPRRTNDESAILNVRHFDMRKEQRRQKPIFVEKYRVAIEEALRSGNERGSFQQEFEIRAENYLEGGLRRFGWKNN